jgi:hypothetical protein
MKKGGEERGEEEEEKIRLENDALWAGTQTDVYE